MRWIPSAVVFSGELGREERIEELLGLGGADQPEIAPHCVDRVVASESHEGSHLVEALRAENSVAIEFRLELEEPVCVHANRVDDGSVRDRLYDPVDIEELGVGVLRACDGRFAAGDLAVLAGDQESLRVGEKTVIDLAPVVSDPALLGRIAGLACDHQADGARDSPSDEGAEKAE
jgi:hypothetical protein